MPSIEANGIVQHVRIEGPAEAPPVLLIHGLGWDASLWRAQVPALVAAGFRVIAPDLRGMGATDKPDAPYSIDLYAADMAALLEALGIARVAAVGFSLGGMILAALALRAPQRIAAAVIACASVSSSAEGQAGTEAMLARAATLGPLRFAKEQADAIWHPAYAAAHPEAVEAFIGWRAAMDQAALGRAFRSAYGVDLRPGLAGLDLPALVVAADADPFLGVDTGRDIAARIPGARFALIEGAGHMAPIERPEAFNALILDFLTAHRPPR
ncbi:alpha/beta fold hydrolase [Prosthecomicrobium pneumaticum]|uniref:Pimeloyl-ACP methyl ester carboxylesterase n=1 Tax=Prosthecomicrobium pneumaticum TaxID=81895 RepID=A0A7W9CW14_9HYPH|nr:alpha/beta fold hydrolase [Prosthecomicrobium pneumaticum]MBB5752709.1 pimeloyl-ACP methyl ester carboxylesterase [Prosthecomicrobium pneumaticum]